MRSRLCILVLSVLLMPKLAGSDERARVREGFMKAEEYLQLNAEEQPIYAVGLINGMYLAPVFDAPNEGKYLSSLQTCLKDMTNIQVAAIITKYIKGHPEKWNMPSNLMAYQALRQPEVCPVPTSAK
jgi:hypothetical protein